MITDPAQLVEILTPLVIDDPWSRSYEGLDDCCQFCNSWSYHRAPDISGYPANTYEHTVDCPWIIAMDALGRPHPNHVATSKAHV